MSQECILCDKQQHGTDGTWSFTVNNMMGWGSNGHEGKVCIDTSVNGNWVYFEVTCPGVTDEVIYYHLPMEIYREIGALKDLLNQGDE